MLDKKEFKEGRFCLFPKIHKKNIPVRPICSTVGHPTCIISKYMDAIIKKYTTQALSYIKDTTDFVKKIKEIKHLPENSLL